MFLATKTPKFTSWIGELNPKNWMVEYQRWNVTHSVGFFSPCFLLADYKFGGNEFGEISWGKVSPINQLRKEFRNEMAWGKLWMIFSKSWEDEKNWAIPVTSYESVLLGMMRSYQKNHIWCPTFHNSGIETWVEGRMEHLPCAGMACLCPGCSSPWPVPQLQHLSNASPAAPPFQSVQFPSISCDKSRTLTGNGDLFRTFSESLELSLPEGVAVAESPDIAHKASLLNFSACHLLPSRFVLSNWW